MEHKFKHLLKLLICVFMLTGIFGCSSSEEAEGSEEKGPIRITALRGYELEEIGMIANPLLDNLKIMDERFVLQEGEDEDKRYTAVSVLGEIKNEKQYIGISKLKHDYESDYSGYYMVSDADKGTAYVGLIDEDGNELINCDALYIKWIGDNQRNNNRYLSVYYYAEEVTEDDPYHFSLWDKNNERHYFSGKGRIYDLENKAFVENIKLDLKVKGIHVCGEDIIMLDSSETFTGDDGNEYDREVYIVYDCNGNEILRTDWPVFVGKDFFAAEDKIYDQSGKQLAFWKDFEEWADPINECSDYLYRESGDVITVMDKNGNELLTLENCMYIEEHNGIICAKTTDEKSRIIDINGTELYTSKDGEYIDWVEDCYWRASDYESEKYTLIGPEGIISDQIASGWEKLVFKDADENGLVINDGTFSVSLDVRYDILVDGLIAIRDEDEHYCVFDIFTGKKLLENEYDKVFYVSGTYPKYVLHGLHP